MTEAMRFRLFRQAMVDERGEAVGGARRLYGDS